MTTYSAPLRQGRHCQTNLHLSLPSREPSENGQKQVSTRLVQEAHKGTDSKTPKKRSSSTKVLTGSIKTHCLLEQTAFNCVSLIQLPNCKVPQGPEHV